MKVLITGVSDAFMRAGFGSSALIHGPNGFVLIDCPDPVHRVLHEATSRAGWTASAQNIHDIIITHLHGDHCNGLESFGFARRIQALNSANSIRPRLHVTPPVAARLWEKLAPAMDAPFGQAADNKPSTLQDYFEVHTLKPETPAIIAGLTVNCRFTKHPIPTIGLLITDANRTLGWAGDTPFEQEHIDWLNAAHLIVHEANLGPAHTPIEKLNALPSQIKSRMRLIHLPDGFDPTRTDIKILTAGEVLTP